MAPLSASITDGLVHDTSALADGADLTARLRAFEAAKDGHLADALASFSVLASDAEALRPLVDPDGWLPISLVADGGLLALQEARQAVQDDTWLDLDHL